MTLHSYVVVVRIAILDPAAVTRDASISLLDPSTRNAARPAVEKRSVRCCDSWVTAAIGTAYMRAFPQLF